MEDYLNLSLPLFVQLGISSIGFLHEIDFGTQGSEVCVFLGQGNVSSSPQHKIPI